MPRCIEGLIEQLNNKEKHRNAVKKAVVRSSIAEHVVNSTSYGNNFWFSDKKFLFFTVFSI